MTEQNEAQESSFDALKWVFVVILVGAAIATNVYLDAYSSWIRWGGIAALSVVAVGIALLTAKGKGFLVSLAASRSELRKVIWPTRKETNQTTLIVLVVVVIMGIILYLIDMLLGWAISSFIG